MMRIFHGNGFGFEPMTPGQFPHLIRIIISHQEIALEIFAGGKQFLMINDRMRIKP